MTYFTSNTYSLKRKILTFTNTICGNSSVFSVNGYLPFTLQPCYRVKDFLNII